MKKILGILVVLVIVAGGYMYFSNNQSTVDTKSVVATNDTKPVQEVVNSTNSTSTIPQATTTPNQTKKSTVVVNSNTNTSASKPIQDVQPTPKPVTTTPPPQKNIYRHASAGYSIEIPTGWVGKPEDTGNSQIFATDFVDPTGKVASGDDLTFVVTATSKKLQYDAYVQAYGKSPTNKDLIDMFMSSQKDSVDGWTVGSESPVTINGLSGYSYTATYGNGYATSKAYMLFGNDYIYLVKEDFPTSKLNSIYSTYKVYMTTFSAR